MNGSPILYPADPSTPPVALVTFLTAALVSICTRGVLRVLAVLGGITLILHGLIALLGVKIRLDAHADLADHRNTVVAGASLIAAAGPGVSGVTVGGTNVAGIAPGTALALLLNLAFRIRGRGVDVAPEAPPRRGRVGPLRRSDRGWYPAATEAQGGETPCSTERC